MKTATLYEQPALFPGVSPYLVPAYASPRARESSPPEQSPPFNHGDLVAPRWQAGRDRRGRVVDLHRKGKHWWAVIAWFEQRQGQVRVEQGTVRTDQLTLAPENSDTPLPPAEPTEEPTAPPSSTATPLPPAEPTATATPPPPPDATPPPSSPFKVGDRVRVSQGCRKGLESTVTAIRPDLYNSIALEPGKGRFPSAMLELVAAPPPAPTSKPERRHSPKGNACGWIEERQGNLKRKVPSTSYYYCWDSPQGRKRVYIKSRLVNTVHQMLENRQSISEILEILGKTEGKPHQS